VRHVGARIRVSALWPKPAAWRAQKAAVASLTSPQDCLRFSAEHFGVVQRDVEILGMLRILSARDPRTACEIGTKESGNLLLLAKTLPGLRVLIGLDLEIRNELRLRYLLRSGPRMVLLAGDSHLSRTRARVAQALQGRALDFLFIDGDHSYEGVKADFLDYRSLVRDGGLIAFHDIVPDHATRYGRASRSNCYAGGVHRLWAQLKSAYPSQEFVADPEQDGFGIGLLEYSSRVSLPDALR
jgi:predicted O-methyltransferase YrrM